MSRKKSLKTSPPSWAKIGVLLKNAANSYYHLVRNHVNCGENTHVAIVLVKRGKIAMTRIDDGCLDDQEREMKIYLFDRIHKNLSVEKKVLVKELLKKDKSGKDLPVKERGLVISDERYRVYLCANGFKISYEEVQEIENIVNLDSPMEILRDEYLAGR